MADLASDFDKEDDVGAAFDAEPEATGEPGHPGHNKYKDGAYAHVDDSPITPAGTPWDAAKNIANLYVIGAGPQIEGAMGALMQAGQNSAQDEAEAMGSPSLGAERPHPMDTYRAVRDMGTRQHDASARTLYGQAAAPIGMMASPVPFKPAAGASIPRRVLHGGLVGGGTAALHGAATSKADLTTLDSGAWKEALTNALVQGVGGVGGGAVTGGIVSKSQSPLKSLAEEQALRAAGLRGGIKEFLGKELGISNMTEARALGRRFLDEELIPVVGSSEAVAAKAKGLEGRAGQSIGSTMTNADVQTMGPAVGGPRPGFDYAAAANEGRRMLGAETAVADDMSGSKASALLDAFQRQGARTPGSFVGANRAKSDAWRSARFDDDAPMSAVLYRKSVGKLRDDIERQVGDALGPDAAANLRASNERFGVSQDALKLAENASKRDASKRGFGLHEIMGVTGGLGLGSSGHATAGAAVAAVPLLAKAFDKYGHSSVSRFADFLAKRAGGNTGGSVGGQLGALGGDKARDALAPYFELLKRPEEPSE